VPVSSGGARVGRSLSFARTSPMVACFAHRVVHAAIPGQVASGCTGHGVAMFGHRNWAGGELWETGRPWCSAIDESAVHELKSRRRNTPTHASPSTREVYSPFVHSVSGASVCQCGTSMNVVSFTNVFGWYCPSTCRSVRPMP
jgi:hypothetical protein